MAEQAVDFLQEPFDVVPRARSAAAMLLREASHRFVDGGVAQEPFKELVGMHHVAGKLNLAPYPLLLAFIDRLTKIINVPFVFH